MVTFEEKVRLTIDMWEQSMLAAQREFYRTLRQIL